jgi:superfamily II DNA or RNA helicase
MIDSSSFSELFELARESAASGEWSRAVTFSRSNDFFLEKESSESIRLRVLENGRPLGMTLILDLDAGDWQIDCSCDDDPCIHVLSGVIALRNGINLQRAGDGGSSGSLFYKVQLIEGKVCVERSYLLDGKRQTFPYSLQDYIGGLQSGRYDGPNLHPAKEDFDLERSLERNGAIALGKAVDALRALKDVAELELPEEIVSITTEAIKPRIRVYEEAGAYRAKRVLREETGSVKATVEFKNGLMLVDGVLGPSALLSLPQKFWRPEGVLYKAANMQTLLTEDLADLRRYSDLQLDVELPALLSLSPEISFHLESESHQLHVTPHLVYGNPIEGRVGRNGLEYSRPGVFIERNASQEKAVLRRLQDELHLRVGHTSCFRGEAAVELREKIKGWRIEGGAKSSFSNLGLLIPQVSIEGDELQIEFLAPEGNAREADPRAFATFDSVWEAWGESERLVPLNDGQWAEIPGDWLSRYGTSIRRILMLRNEASSERVENRKKLMLLELADEMDLPLPRELDELRKRVNRLSEDTRVSLPSDLTAELRDYQRTGVSWLQCLQGLSLGAVLADDMGLGKTLQTICVLKSRSLVVCPTSVLDSWADQIAMFRPGLKVCLYHGAKREFDCDADVVLTSYALMRLEEKRFSENWSVLVLDESQSIKNPSSATAQAAFSLSADFRIAISGTPIENRLDDLWSQFHFTFPELLGSKRKFDKQFSRSSKRSGSSSAIELSKRIAPFILRRRKQEVERELPPKTEVVLGCDLNERERSVYQSIYLASKSTVVNAIGQQGGMMKALEALLRLRQACCHLGLLPEESAESSSKLDLLMERLLLSKESGHRCLVFSQWTSCLDLIEECLKENSLSYLRLDGATKNRRDLISEFQSEDGPDLMLLSLKAGGVGITLTAADHIYLFDSWWNPSVEDQAADRAHRIGQSKPVLVHRLVARDTIEENIVELQNAKRELADDILAGSEAGSSITAKDFEFLFSERTK